LHSFSVINFTAGKHSSTAKPHNWCLLLQHEVINLLMSAALLGVSDHKCRIQLVKKIGSISS